MPRVRSGRFSATSTGRAFPNVGGVRGGRFSATNRGWRFPPVAGTAAIAAALYSQGSFAKATGGAPASQVVAHGLGATPKALLLWATPQTAAGAASHHSVALGIVDGTTPRSVSVRSEDAVVSDSGRRHADKVLSILNTTTDVVLAECDFTSWDGTNFTLSWSTNDANAYIIHFIAIGGPDVQAAVVQWQSPSATGNNAVTGVGFQPDLVLHFTATVTAGAPPTTSASALMGMGAMNSDGEQWAMHIFETDAADPSNTARNYVTDGCYIRSTTSAQVAKAAFGSMDPDGFTLNYSDADTSLPYMFSLCLKGVRSKMSSVAKVTDAAPVSQPVTGVGFQPGLVFLATTAQTSSAIAAHSVLSVGASDGTTEGTGGLSAEDNVAASSDTGMVNKTDKALAILSTSTPASIVAEADMTSLDTGGFTMNWTTNDATAAVLLYMALF